MLRRIVFAAVAIAAVNLLMIQSAKAQSRVRWGRSDPLNGITTGYPPPGGVVNPPLDPYALPPQGGVFGGQPTQPVAPQGFGAVPDPAFNTAPGAQFPNGFGPITGPNWGSPDWGWGDGLVLQEPLRLIQGPRFRHGWIYGRGSRELGINETDISVAVAFPNFLHTTQPLYILPSFSLQMWDGPKGPPHPAMADLPGQTYSAFIDTGWESDRGQMVGFELGLRVGVFSDFSTMTSDSLRVMGKGLVRYRITPALSVRAGIIYIDRLDLKLLPAGGILWEPNSLTRFDFYFPNPKAARYWKTIGNQDVWGFIAAEYGGGSWTIERAVDGLTDRFDYNDIRLGAGVEWGSTELIRDGRRLGFVEVAWVTQRRVLYNRRGIDNFRMTDSVMVRAGFGY